MLNAFSQGITQMVLADWAFLRLWLAVPFLVAPAFAGDLGTLPVFVMNCGALLLKGAGNEVE